jgi:hypothetical protein
VVLLCCVLLLVVVGMSVSFVHAYTDPRTLPSARPDGPTQDVEEPCVCHAA